MLATISPQSTGTAILLLFAATAAAQCNVTWLFPLAGLTINYNDTVIASWTSDCAQPDLLVWGPSSDNSAQVLWDQREVSTNGTLAFSFANGVRSWTVVPFPAHFEVEYNSTSNYAGIDGAVFSITSTSGLPTTYALSTTYVAPTTSSAFESATVVQISTTLSATEPSATTASGSTVTATSTSPSSTTNAASEQLSVGDPPLSAGAKVGLAVGIGAGILALMGALWIYSRWRKRRRYTSVPGQSEPDMTGQDTMPQPQQEKHELGTPRGPYELESDPTPYELHGISRINDGVSAREKSA